jgi:uncharacterized membrane protein
MKRRTGMDRALEDLGAAFFFATLVMAVLKVAGVIALGWRWVLSPLWGATALVFGLYAIGYFITALGHALSSTKPQP